LDFSSGRKELRFRPRSWQVNAGAELQQATISFIPLSLPAHKLETEWAVSCAEVILRRCPICGCDLIIGHGRRRKQAHDAHHDWIEIRRGRCTACGKTFTFLPPLSLPYTHYSLLTRCQALRRRLCGALFLGRGRCQPLEPNGQTFGSNPSPGTIRTYISVVPILAFAVLAFCTFFVPDSSGASGSSVLVGP
jgi:hypothetical protein